jgi:N-acetylmuramoyl-L-alanine amidase
MMRNDLFAKSMIFIWFLAASLAHAAVLQSVEVHQQAGKISLLFSLSEPVPHRVFTLVNPNRLVVDFEKTHLVMNIKNIHVDPRFIKRVRSGQPYPGTLRLVFEVTQQVTPHTNHWSGGAKNPHGLRLDLAQQKFVKNHPLAASTQTHPIVAAHAPNQRLRTIVVVLDPGHGGKDPGAHGPRASKEKEIVLAIARRLKTLIDKEPGMRAVLTRQSDYYIELRQRLQIARRDNADVFVSIHADAFKNSHSGGASVNEARQPKPPDGWLKKKTILN